MDRYKKGMLALSLAGHDAGKVYVIMDVDDTYIYLADGKIRTMRNCQFAFVFYVFIRVLGSK